MLQCNILITGLEPGCEVVRASPSDNTVLQSEAGGPGEGRPGGPMDQGPDPHTGVDLENMKKVEGFPVTPWMRH